LEPSAQVLVLLGELGAGLLGELQDPLELVVLSQQILQVPFHLRDAALIGAVLARDLYLELLLERGLSLPELFLHELALLQETPYIPVERFVVLQVGLDLLLVLLQVPLQLPILASEIGDCLLLPSQRLLQAGYRPTGFYLVLVPHCGLQLQIPPVHLLQLTNHAPVSILHLDTLLVLLSERSIHPLQLP
jgi:hypothetical protein